MPETAKKVDAIISKGMSIIITIALGISVWYLGGINTSMEKINTKISSIDIQYSVFAEKLNTMEKAQYKTETEIKSLIKRVVFIEKWISKIDEVLIRHETMINDKRRCVSCVKDDPN